MKSLKDNRLFLGALLPVFAGYLLLAWQPIEKLLSAFLVDDSFYYFKPASNLAMGLGPTFDGEHLANGYHPLWMGISAAIYYLFPGDRILPIHIILTLSVLFFFGSAFFCWKIISRLVADRSARIILILSYALNPWNVSNTLNGLETPLALFMLSALFWILLGILDGRNNISDFLMLGAVGGLAVLARLDHGLFLAAIFLYFVFSGKFSWKSVSAFFLPAFLLAAPWFMYNYLYFGSPIPASGLSYTMINYRLWFYKDRSAIQVVLWSLYNFLGTVAFTLRTIGLPNYYSGYDLWKSFLSLSAIFLPVMSAVTYFYVVRKNQFLEYLRKIMSSGEWKALVIFFAAYSGLVIVHGGIRWSAREWYFASFSFLVSISLALFIGGIHLSDYRRRILIFFALLLGLSFFISWGNVFTQYGSQREMYNTAMWVRDNLPEDARIAAFNSGILGYFSDHYVMNSDGLINNSAFEAMKRNRLWDLFKKERIDYIVDYEITLTYRFKTFLGIENPLANVKRIELPATSGPSFKGYGGSSEGVFRIIYE